MTIDEAIKNRENCLQYLEGIGQKASPDCVEAVRWSVKALKALRPVSREQVEKAWMGHWVKCKHADYYVCNKCSTVSKAGEDEFCKSCGAPMTDEAVDMVMERLEALFGERNDD